MAEGFITRKGGKGGVDVSDANAVESEVLQGKTFYAGDEDIKTGTIPSKSAQTFTPGTTNQTIAAGQFLSGTQTIQGDADLVADNIRSGVTIFGVDGNVVGGVPNDTIDNVIGPGVIFQTLYDRGDQKTSLTGGWEQFNYREFIGGSLSSGQGNDLGILTFNPDNMFLRLRRSRSHVHLRTVNKLSGYANIYVEWEHSNTGQFNSSTKAGVSDYNPDVENRRTTFSINTEARDNQTLRQTVDAAGFPAEHVAKHVFFGISSGGTGGFTNRDGRIYVRKVVATRRLRSR